MLNSSKGKYECKGEYAWECHLQSEVLDIVLEGLGGINRPSDMGDVEGASCRVVKTKNNIHLRNNVMDDVQSSNKPAARHKATHRSANGETRPRVVRKPVLMFYTRQWRRKISQPMSVAAGGSLRIFSRNDACAAHTRYSS